ncbi:HAD family hydrolase [Comamonas testosteroni]|uniref:HAD family hydrolase n=1 Tax=Comamonas testosteroni TaxID=285 RepID=UPI0005B4AFA0|nr:HAD family hydrolase [Comamonas testosteroni]
MNASRIIAVDADGVLLDYNLAYASAWERVFGERPALKRPGAYWAMDRWGVASLQGEALSRFRASLDAQFWSSIPAIAGALQACEQLCDAGYELVCVSAIQPQFAEARQVNLRRLGFPISRVIATSGSAAPGPSPKAQALAQLQPLAFVDDFLPYFDGVDARIHKALVLREQGGSPNTGPGLQAIDSTHATLADFSPWWLNQYQEEQT